MTTTDGPRRAAIYARFSTELQNPLSTADQITLCREYARREGFHVVAAYEDAGISGAAIQNRPGLINLLDDAKAGKFDAVIVEELDRLSRSMADLAGIFDKLTYIGIKIIAVHGGEADTITVALRGLTGQMYREDTARKVHRGLSGNVARGKRAGGSVYGYRPNPADRGNPVIVDEEAAIIERIFRLYAEGMSPRSICAQFNAAHMKPPRGKLWEASALYGCASRGTGILRNEQYAGRIVWNKTKTIKDPETGRRTHRPNPRSEWQSVEAEHLRILPDDLFNAVQRQLAERAHVKHTNPNVHRRPKHLLSGLMRCALCGSNVSVQGTNKAGRTRLHCSARAYSGACDSPLFYKDEVEELFLDSLCRELANPEQIEAYAAAWAHRVNASADHDNRRRKQITKRLAEIEKTNTRMTEMLIEGLGDTLTLNRKIKEQANERDDLQAELQLIAPASNIAVHPSSVTQFARKLQASRAKRELVVHELKDTGQLHHMVRELVDHVTLSKDEDGRLAMEVTCRFEPLLSENAPSSPRDWGVVSVASVSGQRHAQKQEVKAKARALGGRILFISNGHGEDTDTSFLIRALREADPDLDARAVAIVGDGGAYRRIGVPVVAPTLVLPSGGFTYVDRRLLIGDIKAGLIGNTIAQWRAMRRAAAAVDLVVATGDTVSQSFAFGSKKPFVSFIASLSALYEGTLRLDPLMRIYFRSPRCRLVLTRDDATRADLQRQGFARTAFGGMPSMDFLAASGRDLEIPAGSRMVGLLPGSRIPEAPRNFRLQLRFVEAVAAIAGDGPAVVFRAALVPGVMAGLTETAAAEGWSHDGHGRLTKAGPGGRPMQVRCHDDAFADILEACTLVIGMAGQAADQALALGKPSLMFAGEGPQFSYPFAEAQSRIHGGLSVLVGGGGPADDATIAEAARRLLALLRDEAFLARAREKGPLQFGSRGSSARFVGQILPILEKERAAPGGGSNC